MEPLRRWKREGGTFEASHSALILRSDGEDPKTGLLSEMLWVRSRSSWESMAAVLLFVVSVGLDILDQ